MSSNPNFVLKTIAQYRYSTTDITRNLYTKVIIFITG